MALWRPLIIILLWGVFALMFACLKLSFSYLATVPRDDLQNQQLEETTTLLEDSERRNVELNRIIDKLLREKFRGNEIESVQELIPQMEYEQLRRRTRSNIIEMYNYVTSELASIQKNPKTENINKVIQMTAQHKHSLINDMDRMQEIDGFARWRNSEAENLGALVQRRLKDLQNPKDCRTAKKLVCRINLVCGFGCEVHHAAYCLIMANATQRTLILRSELWRYHKNGWEDIFKPLSETCTTFDGSTYERWVHGNNETQVLDLPVINFLPFPLPQLPMAIPDDLAARLKRFHGHPFVWWAGQILKYLLRYQPETQRLIDAGIQELGFQNPIVGVHIRRTDKVEFEADSHNLEEYMKFVDEYYDQLEMIQNVEKRRVFLASDNAKVIDEAREKYPEYEIIGNLNAAHLAELSTRFSTSSLYGLLLDIHLLSLSDYLVCTFSSNICRMAYELMQTMHPDASQRFKSLDDIYFFNGQNAHNLKAVLPHRPMTSDEIEMDVGDLVGVAGNRWNGFSLGINLRTNQSGLFPSFKVVDKTETADFPKYST